MPKKITEGEMKTEAKLYKEYLDWAKEQNAPGLKKWKESRRKYRMERKRKNDNYERKLKRWKSNRKFYKDQIKAWELKGPLYKSFNPRPTIPSKYELWNGPMESLGSIAEVFLQFLPYYPKEIISMEGFYRWLVEVKYKLIK